jgi:hypothetical protein
VAEEVIGPMAQQIIAHHKDRADEMEDALTLIAEKSEAAVRYLKDSGEELFLQYARGTLDTARKALRK